MVYSWPGPAFVMNKGTKTSITWRNGLKGKHMFTIEKNLDFMHKYLNLEDFIPNVAHIHGMANPSNVDGMPEAWYTFDGRHGDRYFTTGPKSLRNQSTVSIEVNQQESMLFYHDHSIAMTRLNVYSGLAGLFLIQDLHSPLSELFNPKHDIILAISDRKFNEDGSLYYPDVGPAKKFPNWVPEFYGDVMVVNGKAYPNMNVERNRYRVRLLNACNSRGLTISFKVEETGALLPFLLYKTDSSYHYKPVEVTEIVMPVAGRIEIVMDFTNVRTKRVIMQNVPFPNKMDSDVVDRVPLSTDSIMSFTPSVRVRTPIPEPNR